MGPTVAATTTALAESSDGDHSAKKKGIRRLLTPAIFAGGDHKNKQSAASSVSSAQVAAVDVGSAAAVHSHQHRPPSNNKTIIETAFINNNGNGNSTGNVAYRLQQQQQQLQRFRYTQGADRHAVDVTDFRSRSVSPGSFDRDVNANYGSVERRTDSPCSLLSSSSTSSLLPSPSGRRSAPIIPYSQYYNNRNGGGDGGGGGGGGSQQQRMLLMPVGAQVKITTPPSSNTAVYAAAVRQHRLQQQQQQQQQRQQQQAIYGNVVAGAAGPFVRGSPHRATIGCVRESPGRQSTIYETEEDVVASAAAGEKRFQPIFKRGALQEPASDPSAAAAGQTSPPPLSSGCSPKRVSFSPGPSEPPAYWPTKKGPSPQPPTRQRSTDSPVAAERPLPLVPKRSPSTSAIYGTLQQRGGQQRPHQQQQQQQPPSTPIRWWPPPSPSPLHQHYQQSGSESGSEAGEVQRILNAKNGHRLIIDDDWSGDGKTRGAAEQAGDELRRGRSSRRDDPRRHTLSGDQHHNYQPALTRSMDLESPASRGGYPPATGMLFDDDPGIMSEVETSSTGFRRGNKQRSSLPVVRTPSKTLERPLGLVFLQYRSETKRALLPNEITSIDTVKALFVRSFPKQLTMEYMDSALVKIYIHDSSKDMFYELEDLRSHLNDIRDRSVLRLFESAEGGPLPQGLTIAAPTWDQDQSYFSEPEFDSEYQHQHIHKTKGSKCTSGGAPGQPYYMTHQFPPGSSATLPNRGRPPTGSIPARAYSPAVPPVAANKSSGYMSSPERASSRTGGYTAAPYMSPGGSSFDDNSYYGYGPRTGSITPVIDEETRIRVENMERQIANLTGLVQKALTHAPVVAPPFRNASDEFDKVSGGSTTSLADKSVSFEKSVSFSDEPPDMNSPKQHSPQSSEKDRFKPHPPPKPSAIPGQYDDRHLYSDLQLTPEMYNQLRVLQKKAKDLRQEARNLRRMSQAQAHSIRETIKDTFIKIRTLIASGADQAWSESGSKERAHVDREEDIYRQEIIRLETDLTELESTVEELRGNVINKKSRVNMSDVENMALVLSKSSKTVAELKLRFPSLQESIRAVLTKEMDRAVTEEKFLKEEPDRLESALKRCKKLTGTLVTLKRLASVQEQRLPDARLSPTNEDNTPPITPTSSAKGSVAGQGSVVEQTGTGTDDGSGSAGKREPTGAENALDTLLDELQTIPAAVPVATAVAAESVESAAVEPTAAAAAGAVEATAVTVPVTGPAVAVAPKPVLRRLSSTSSEAGGKPPVPERTPDLQNKRMPPPPPPRTSSKSPVASPTTAGSAVGAPTSSPRGSVSSSSAGGSPPSRKGSLTIVALSGCGKPPMPEPPAATAQQPPPSPAAPTAVATTTRQEQLEQRHQELLKKQKALQEQYTRLQQLQRSQPPPDLLQLKKTGSEGNLLLKMGLSMSAAAPISGSLTQLAAAVATNTTSSSSNSSTTATAADDDAAEKQRPTANNKAATAATTTTTVSKVYETDII